jgi:site-specific DNA-cytosine methylase
MRVLIACEFSGIVRDAFAARGHEALSCDLLPSERGGNHYQGDVRDIIGDGWDLMVAHPPCTHLAVSGARWFCEKRVEQAEALEFVRFLMDAPIPHIALENPVSVISSRIRKPDQIIQPWQFGHGETKATCLWLKGLPLLRPTQVVDGREASVHKMAPGPERWRERSRTFEGIAEAMAEQWGALDSSSPADATHRAADTDTGPEAQRSLPAAVAATRGGLAAQAPTASPLEVA